LSEVTIVYKPSGTCLNILSECLNELGKTGFRAKALWIDEVDKGTLDSAEIIIALGGDGTLLRISWSLRSSEPLIIPIPCGRRTFFYENLGELKFSEILSKFVNGEFFIERIRRLMIFVEGEYKYFINETLIVNKDLGKVTSFEVSISTPSTKSKYVIEGDGILISTPWGSSAHNLSAHGPVVEAFEPCMILTPYTPVHMNISPLVLHPLSRVEVVSRNPTVLYIDGRGEAVLPGNSKVIVFNSDSFIRLVRFSTYRNSLAKIFPWRTASFE